MTRRVRRSGQPVLAALRGPGRRATHRRDQLRRASAALLAGVAVWAVLAAVVPKPPETGVPVLVATRDLRAGDRLTAGDVTTTLWPGRLRPTAALTEAETALGHVLSSAVTTGEPFTTARFRGAGMLSAAPVGTVAAHVPLADPGAVALLAAGDAVDVLSAATGEVLAATARVLDVDRTDGAGPLSGDATGGITVAVDPSGAAALARASGIGGPGVFVVLRRPGK